MTIHAHPRAEGAVRLPLRLNDLVRDVDREPRLPDLVLADRLGFAKPHNVRRLIDRNRDELALHGTLVERPSSFLRDGENLVPAWNEVRARNRGGRPGTMYLLNEGQALVVCVLSRTPIASKVRQDVIAVYMAHRRGEDWSPTGPHERAALRHLVAHGTVVTMGEPLAFDDSEGIVVFDRTVFVSPVTACVLDALAAFDEHDGREGQDGGIGIGIVDPDIDYDIVDHPHDGAFEGNDEPSLGATGTQNGTHHLWGWKTSFSDCEDDVDRHEGDSSEDREHDLGWSENVGQLRLGEGHGDGDSTAPERAGAGFVRCGLDEHEATLGWGEGIWQVHLHGGQQDGEGEPSLGSLEHTRGQASWGSSGVQDRELGDDNGIGDGDGAEEVFYGADSDGDFSGGGRVGADEDAVRVDGTDPAVWVRA